MSDTWGFTWTQPQVDMLNEIYGYVPNNEIAEIINAATGSRFDGYRVKCKFNKLKQPKAPAVIRELVWTAELIAMLRKHAEDGLSFGAIAVEINKAAGTSFTRSAIAGAMLRWGVPKPKRAVNRLQAARAADNRQRIAKKLKPHEPQTYSKSLDILFLDREPNQCAFPTSGEGLSMLVCGNVTADSSYCGWHCSIAYQPYKRTERSSFRAGHMMRSFGA